MEPTHRGGHPKRLLFFLGEEEAKEASFLGEKWLCQVATLNTCNKWTTRTSMGSLGDARPRLCAAAAGYRLSLWAVITVPFLIPCPLLVWASKTKSEVI